MARASGLMNPENASKSAGLFKEGYVRIEANSYKVHKGKAGDTGDAPIPATKWVWQVTRLAEDGETPLTDEHDEPVKEELLFSFGTKSLPFVHPGKADSPDDDEVEDLGTSEGAEGNTIYLNAPDWTPNEKSGLMTLTRSMVGQNIKAEYLNRCWAPDWNGCVFQMKSHQGEKGNDGRAFNYKIVGKVMVGPGGKKPAAKGGAKAPAEAEAILAPVLHALSEEMDGQTMTRKAFLNRVRASLDATKMDSKLLVPVLSLAKDDKWLASHAETFDYTLYAEDQTILFGRAVQP